MAAEEERAAAEEERAEEERMAAEEEERMAEQEERAEEERAAAEEERAAAEEERAALAAIFCGPGEWEVLGRSETRGSVCRVRTTAEGPSGPDTPLELVFHLPAGYPACPPGVSVGSERLTRAQCAALRDQLLEQARAFPPEPMVHQLVLWAQQNLRHLLAPPGSGAGPGGCATAGPGEAEAPWTALVRLDHMRAKASYTRTLRHWASALGLAGRLLFAGRVILLLLQGPRDRVKREENLGPRASGTHRQHPACPAGVPGAAEDLQGGRGLEWEEVQREDGQRAVGGLGAAGTRQVPGL
uniref:RWD domain-containing protein 3 n=1 Tax=Pipistrellus kuhlii TaxID=59472 RepID=A0A7J7TWH6_PIPKU|nr:RWD domain containing 3 [Pipistrellus kuhlii]